MNTSDFKSFNYLENGDIEFSNYDTIKSAKTLSPGYYDVTWLDYPHNRVALKTMKIGEKHNIHSFPDKDRLDNLFEAFFTKEVADKIASLGFLHKVGILFEGREGTGKSTIVNHYCRRFVEEHNSLMFYISRVDNYVIQCWEFIQKIRRIQVVVVFEEIDTLVEMEQTGLLKEALDGKMSITNAIVFGTTNNIETIPNALKKRLSRFKYCLNIEGIQSIDDIKNILTPMIEEILEEAEINSLAEELKGNSLDIIKQRGIDILMDIKHCDPSKLKKIGF